MNIVPETFIFSGNHPIIPMFGLISFVDNNRLRKQQKSNLEKQTEREVNKKYFFVILSKEQEPLSPTFSVSETSVSQLVGLYGPPALYNFTKLYWRNVGFSNEKLQNQTSMLILCVNEN